MSDCRLCDVGSPLNKHGKRYETPRENRLVLGKWDNRFMELAQHVAQWSKDPNTKVGAVIVDENRCVVSLGFNGFPRGVSDAETNYEDRDIKLSMIVHAEINAILTANRSVRGLTLYSSMFTCSECAKMIIQSGIKRVVAPVPKSERWQKSFDISMKMYNDAEIKVELI